MNVLSLFDGISCGQIALNRAGIHYDNYFASEIDKYAIKVTQHNYPQTIQLGDVSKIRGAELPKIDLLIGGSPCQGFSYLGKQLNFEDHRSKLFFEFVRLLKETNPTYFLLENVKMKQEYVDVISNELGVAPININSSLVSAQLRNRYYWTNIQKITAPKDRGINLNSVLEYGKSERNKAVTLLASYCLSLNSPGSVSHYLRKHIGQIIPDASQKTGWRVLTLKEACRLQTIPDDYLDVDIPINEKYKCLGNGWTVDVIVHILKSMKTCCV